MQLTACAFLLLLGVLGLSILRYVFFTPLYLLCFFRAQGIRGTPFKPLIGDLLTLAARRKMSFFDWFSQWDEQYGKMYWFFLGSNFRLRVSSPNLANEILVTHAECFHKTALLRGTLGRVVKTGLLLSEGDVHRRHRSLISPAFTFIKLQGMAPLIARAAARACRALAAAPARAAAAAPDAHEHMSNLALFVIGQAAFGADFEGLLPPAIAGGEEDAPAPRATASAAGAAGVHKALNFLLDYMVSMTGNPLLLLPGWDALPVAPKADALIADLRGLAGGVIAARRAARRAAAAAGAAPAAEPDNLLDQLLDAESGGNGFSPEEVLDEALTFVLAGHETTAKALSWSLLLLAQHPAWAARVRAEASAALGAPPRLPTREDLPRLPLLAATLQEALRLYPPAPVVARECVRECALAGAPGELPGGARELRVARGTAVVIPVAALQRDPELWEDPLEFKPQRWLVEGGARFSATACLKHPLAFSAFSHGPRNCVGAGFAQVEAKIILAVLVSRLEWEVGADYVHHPSMAITLRPAHGMPMRFRERASGK
jgi:cytokinin trans-hydroxylase